MLPNATLEISKQRLSSLRLVDKNADGLRALGVALTLFAMVFFGLTPNFTEAAPVPPTHWPQFRGADSLGVADGSRFPDHWGTNENVAWKIPIPGRGWSSPIVWGNRVFLTTVTTDAAMQEPKKGLYFGGDRQTAPHDEHHWTLLCFRLDTGQELWRSDLYHGTPSTPTHIKNTYASETPVTDGERVYTYFGNVGLYCTDLFGKLLWSTNWPPVKTRYGWGSAASPVVHQDRLFLVNDNEEHSFVTALDTKSGRTLWRVERDEPSNWATPYVWKHRAHTELVTPGQKKIRSYDLDGKLLWECGGMSTIVIPTPFSHDDLLYVCSGYVGDKIRPVFTIRAGASGDISLKEGQSTNDFIAWSQSTGAPYNPSPLLYRDTFYVLYDFGFLSGSDALTGKILFEKQRIRTEATSFTASPWAAGGKIYVLSEDGDTFVFQAGTEFRLLHKNSLDEMCMATPAIVGDSLVIRTLKQLYCIRSPSPRLQTP
jgi:outer membrane protein assembly factor BamB